MSQKKVGPEVFIPILAELAEAGVGYFVEGGQAVNFWAALYRDRYPREFGLEKWVPYNSKDCDVWIDYKGVQFFKKASGRLALSNSPADGQFAIYTLPDEAGLTVDLMTSVYGIPMREIPKALGRVRKANGINLLDPIYLFKAKCHNLANLPQGGRQDGKHVGMMMSLLPAYFRSLLEEIESGVLTERQVLKEMKFLQSQAESDAVVAGVLKEQGKGFHDLLPMTLLLSRGEGPLVRFVSF